MISKEMPGLETFLNGINTLGRSFSSRKVMEKMARKCREIIYRRVKSGKGVNDDEKPAEATTTQKLARLSKSYIEQRKGLAIFRHVGRGGKKRIVRFGTSVDLEVDTKIKRFKKSGKKFMRRVAVKQKVSTIGAPLLGEFGAPGKSNLTMTGQMLDSITIGARDGVFSITIPPSMRSDGKTNAQVLKYVSKGGSYTNANGNRVTIPARPFFALTEGELRILTREMETIIRDLIKQKGLSR